MYKDMAGRKLSSILTWFAPQKGYDKRQGFEMSCFVRAYYPVVNGGCCWEPCLYPFALAMASQGV